MTIDTIADPDGCYRFLEDAWHCEYEEFPRDLISDLARMRSIFGAGAKSASVKAHIQAIHPSRGRGGVPGGLSPTFYFPVSGVGGLVTPEGRILLAQLSGEGPAHFPDSNHLERTALEFYSRGPRDAIAALTMIPNQRPSTLAFLLFLLINGSMSPSRALVLPSAGPAHRQVAAALVDAMSAFNGALHAHDPEPPGVGALASWWPTTEATRHFWQFTRRERVDDTGPRPSGTAISVVEAASSALVEELAVQLAGRRGVTEQVAIEGASGLANAHRRHRASLLSLGMCFDDPVHTDGVVSRLARIVGLQHQAVR